MPNPIRHLPSFPRLTAAVALGALTMFVFGFVVFFLDVVTMRPDTPELNSDAIIVLTGGSNRVETGFDLMAHDRAQAMLVTGVHPDVTLPQLLAHWNAGSAADRTRLAAHCCIFLEHKAETTEDNAAEALGWVNRNGGAQGMSIRLVTSDYHMPRAMLLFRRAMPEATLEAWPVASPERTGYAFIRQVFIEYCKTFVMWLK
ncbi:MAG: YdcF family protein [Alphaproteobacteria bacterium]|nr:YdcF family protein [Alphaproteobacteria bacterium]USO07491.1 MAG: YdcF family protein [Rhodospirillales bacterium]